MSEYINNHSQRQEILKQLIRQLHEGKTVDEVKAEFAHLLQSVGAGEIAQMEQALIAEGLPEAEIKRLCDVHVAVFQESLEIQPRPESIPGHPIHTLRAENAAVEGILSEMQAALDALRAGPGPEALRQTQAALTRLRQYEKHYLRKENLLFPFLEQHDFRGPSAVMWAIHDDIRAGWKALDTLLNTRPTAPAAWLTEINQIFKPMETAIRQMVYKEENILFPTALEKLSELEWAIIQAQEAEIGWAYVRPGDQWPPAGLAQQAQGQRAPRPEYAHSTTDQTDQPVPEGAIPLDVGALTVEQINLLLKNLPVDVTLVDEKDEVRFFSQTRERIFPRTPAIIGRRVQNCHPPASVHRVQQILNDFRDQKRNEAEFWIQSGGRFIHIRYFALRNEQGQYRGTLEVTQEVSAIRALQGEKRLLDD